MPYLLNPKSGKIHHSDMPHVQNKPAYISFLTIQEAIAYAKDNGKQPSPCARCQFPQAVRDEINR